MCGLGTDPPASIMGSSEFRNGGVAEQRLQQPPAPQPRVSGHGNGVCHVSAKHPTLTAGLERSTGYSRGTECGGPDGAAACGTRPAKVSGRVVVCTRQQVVLVLLSLANFLLGASVSLQAPFFPHEAEIKDVTATQCGLVFSVFEFTIFIMAPIFGKIVPIVKPKFMLLSGLFYVGGASVIFGFLKKSPPGSVFLGLAIATRAVEGLGTASFMTAVFAIVAAEFPRSLGTTYSVQQTAFGAGLVAGPTVGGFLYQAGGFIVPFAAVGSLLLVCGIFVYLMLPAIEDDNEVAPKSGDMLKFWCNAGILLDAYCVFSTFLIIGFNAACLEPHLRQGRAKELCILAGLLMCVCLLLVGPAPFLPLSTAVWTVMLALGIFGFASGGTNVCSFAGSFRDTLKRGFPDDLSTYGLVSSVFTASHSMGAFVGPTLGGYLLDTVGYRMATMVLLGNELLLVAWLCFYVLARRQTAPDREPLLKEVM
ncbi:MFS-type transporter SLC18B1-like isoform X2 [Haemaphysalis longicornis]